MSKSIADVRKEMVGKYKTESNTYKDFEPGTKVKVITPCQDMNFFYGETGVVTRNNNRYLGIWVEFDEPRVFSDNSKQEGFNFEPEDLINLGWKIPVRIES